MGFIFSLFFNKNDSGNYALLSEAQYLVFISLQFRFYCFLVVQNEFQHMSLSCSL